MSDGITVLMVSSRPHLSCYPFYRHLYQSTLAGWCCGNHRKAWKLKAPLILLNVHGRWAEGTVPCSDCPHSASRADDTVTIETGVLSASVGGQKGVLTHPTCAWKWHGRRFLTLRWPKQVTWATLPSEVGEIHSSPSKRTRKSHHAVPYGLLLPL